MYGVQSECVESAEIRSEGTVLPNVRAQVESIGSPGAAPPRDERREWRVGLLEELEDSPWLCISMAMG